MKNAFIINAHQHYPFSEGRLNGTLAKRIEHHLTANGYDIKTTSMADAWSISVAGRAESARDRPGEGAGGAGAHPGRVPRGGRAVSGHRPASVRAGLAEAEAA